jgi:hypothetical protein
MNGMLDRMSEVKGYIPWVGKVKRNRCINYDYQNLLNSVYKLWPVSYIK